MAGLRKLVTFARNSTVTSNFLKNKSCSLSSLNANQRLITHTSCLKAEQKMDKDSVMVRIFEPGKALPHQQWIIRSNNQNVYLSWCRNSYICLSVSVAVVMSQKCLAPLPCDADVQGGVTAVAHILLLLSQVNMLLGSAEYIYHLLMTRSLTQMSWITTIFYVIFALAHAYIYLEVFSNLEESEKDDEV